MRRKILPCIALATVSLAPLTAHATGTGEVSVTGKGIVGGTLLGAEIVTATEAAFKVQPAWAYIVGGLGGAAAGGVGGYFIEQNGSPKTNVFILAGGMALLIPTTVAVLSATAYEPPANYMQDRPPADEPVAEPPQPAGAQPASTPAPSTVTPTGTEVTPPAATPTPAPSGAMPHKPLHRLPPYRLTPPALIAFTPEALSLNVPAVEVSGRYSREELAMYGLTQATEVRVPVLNFVF